MQVFHSTIYELFNYQEKYGTWIGCGKNMGTKWQLLGMTSGYNMEVKTSKGIK